MKSARSSRINLYALSLVFAIGLETAPVLAQTPPPAGAKPDIETILSSKKVSTGADKKEVLVEAKTVKPGEVIEYQVSYTNKSNAVVSKLTANLPIPEGTEFLRVSAPSTAPAKATLGDGKYESIPLKRKVKTADGKEVEREVPLAQYKALQWSLGDLPAGKTVVVVARVRVSDAPSVSVAAPASTVAAAAVPATGQK